MVKTIFKRHLFDEVWYVPVAVHQPIFTKNMSSATDRVNMLNLVLTRRARIETFEYDSRQESHTHTTLRALSAKLPEYHFSFLMGSDQLKSLSLWNCEKEKHCFPHMASEYDFYVYPRAGFAMNLPYDNLKIIEDVEPMAVSSTIIREKVKKGESIRDLVDPRVEAYIREHELYAK